MTQTQDERLLRPAPPSRRLAEPPPSRDRRTFVIRPAPRWPHLDVPELWHYREVLGTIVWRDVKVRYKQTFLGVVWAILVPAFTATVYVVVFGKFAKFPSGNVAYPSLVVAGVIPMQYFASALSSSSLSLVTNLALVTKVYFPRVLLPLAAVLVPVVDFPAPFGPMTPSASPSRTWKLTSRSAQISCFSWSPARPAMRAAVRAIESRRVP